MIKNYLKKVIALGIIATSIIALNPVGASAAWREDNSGWWYTDGDSWATGWKKIEGKWYYFYQNGYMAKSTQIDGYQIDSEGVAESNTVSYQNPSYQWKMKNEAAGDSSNNYSYIENGNVIGEMIYKNNYLYYKENGQYYNGWKRLGGTSGLNWYYMEEGKRCIGWKNIDGNWYYFSDLNSDSDTKVENLKGKMINSSLLTAGKSYQFDDHGVLQSTIER